jgi:hypothetical protein
VTSQQVPVVTSSGVVSVARGCRSTRAPTGRLGRARQALRRLHDLPGADRLPAWQPLRRLPAQLEHLDARSAARLAGARSRALDELADLAWVLPAGALHGDVSADNVLADAGRPALDRPGLRLPRPARVRPVRGAAAPGGRRAVRGGVPHLLPVVRRRPGRLAGLQVLDAACALSGLGFRLWLDRRAGRPSSWLGAELDRLSERVPAAR